MAKKLEYKPRKGFYDLSKKPKTLTKKEHQKLQDTQMILMEVENRKDEYMQDKVNWRVVQEMSAKLQRVIFRHYDVGVFSDV